MAKKVNKPISKKDFRGIEKKISLLDKKVSKIEKVIFEHNLRDEKAHRNFQGQIDEKFDKILTGQNKILNELQDLREETIAGTYLFKTLDTRVNKLESRVKKLEEKVI